METLSDILAKLEAKHTPSKTKRGRVKDLENKMVKVEAAVDPLPNNTIAQKKALACRHTRSQASRGDE